MRNELHSQVRRTIEEGAQLLLGGKIIGSSQASYYEPTVLEEVTPRMTAFREETFGPAAAIITATDVEHAVSLANKSEFGLSSPIWSADASRAKVVARRLETEGVFINSFSASDPRTPIGEIKKRLWARTISFWHSRIYKCSIGLGGSPLKRERITEYNFRYCNERKFLHYTVYFIRIMKNGVG